MSNLGVILFIIKPSSARGEPPPNYSYSEPNGLLRRGFGTVFSDKKSLIFENLLMRFCWTVFALSGEHLPLDYLFNILQDLLRGGNIRRQRNISRAQVIKNKHLAPTKIPHPAQSSFLCDLIPFLLFL